MGGEAKPPKTSASRHTSRLLWPPLKALARVFRQASSEWINDNAPRLGAAVAFYALLSLAPLIVIAVAAAALVYGQQAAQGQLASEIRGVAGPDVARTIQEIIRGAYKPETGVIATVLGLVTLAFGATSVFVELHDAMNTIWNVPLPAPEPMPVGLSDKGSLLFVRDGTRTGFLPLVFLVLNAWIAAMEIGAAGRHVHDVSSGNSGVICGSLQDRSGR
jgi:membrane protein